MAITDKNEADLALALGVGINYLTFRHKAWIWLVMTYGAGAHSNFASQVKWPYDSVGMTNYFRNNPQDKKLVSSFFNVAFLSDDSLDWIEDDKRQNQWLLDYLRSSGWFDNFKVDLIRTVLTGRDLIVALIDWYFPPVTQKASQVDSIRLQWNDYLKTDRIFDWFSKQAEAERCNLMWEVLLKQDFARLNGQSRFRDLHGMLQFFDSSGYTYEQKQLWVNSVKKSWTQTNYRQNLDGKKQVNLVMALKAINQLDRLADEFGLSRVKILETLIHDEAKKKIYLSERLRRVTALTSTDNPL